jgi:hypothetical protein
MIPSGDKKELLNALLAESTSAQSVMIPSGDKKEILVFIEDELDSCEV